MEKTSRRHLLRAAAAGGVVAIGWRPTSGGQRALAASAGVIAAQNGHAHGRSHPLSGNHASATVSFGQWAADPDAPFDRQPVNSDRTRNVHELLPFEAEIDEGGSINFIISGVHQVLVYSDSIELATIQAVAKDPANHLAGAPPLVNYAVGRVYRGLDPRVLTYATLVTNPANPQGPLINLLVQDRTEAVHFAKAGRYLVVCGVVPHLVEGMHGYVTVREKRPE